jgi:hypothetical protein
MDIASVRSGRPGVVACSPGYPLAHSPAHPPTILGGHVPGVGRRELPESAFIKKPFDREELIGIVTDALWSRR